MEPELTQLKAFKQITLTDEERDLLRVHAARIVIASPVLVTESFFKRGMQHGLRIALSSMLFVVLVAGSVSALASNELPGDLFYGVKTDVNEKVEGLLLKADPAEEVAFQQDQVETRVNEIQTLAESNSLTQAKQEIAEKALNSNVEDLSANLTTLSAQAPNAAITVTASLEQTLKANKAAIESTPDSSTTEDTGKADALKTVDATLQTVSNQEVQIISNEIDTINSAVNTIPTTSTETPSTSPLTITPSTS